MNRRRPSVPTGRSPLLQMRDAAALLGICERKLWSLANAGEVPSIRIGRRCVRFDPLDLEEFIRRHKTTGGSQ